MTVGECAQLLYILGGILAIAGPVIAIIRTAKEYGQAKEFRGSWNDFDDAFNAEKVHAAAKSKAWWGVAEFSLVGLGAALAAVASWLLVP